MRTPILSSPSSGARLGGRRLLFLGLALPPALIAAVLLGALLYRPPAAPPPSPVTAAADDGAAVPPPAGLLVEVTGAVQHPGVYRIPKGERVSVAITAAGGLTGDADPDRLPNMAARLQDGQQIRVPSRLARSSSGAGSTRLAAVDLNVATEDQLAAVPGFTPELAAAAIRYRQEYGGFTSTRELVDVLEMGEANYVLARRYLTV